MDQFAPAPTLADNPIMRINGELIPRYVGSMISIVGTVENIMGNTVTLRTSDEKSATVIASNGFAHAIGRVVEVIGTVEGNGTIVMQFSSGFDGSYNAHAYNKLVEYMNGKFNEELF